MMKKSLLMATLMCLAICGFALANGQEADSTSSSYVVCGGHDHYGDSETCRYCNGRGTYDCNMCDATGWRICSMCNGSGEIVYRNGDKEVCEYCNGKGKFQCGYCTRGQRKCTVCNGSGVAR